MSIGEHVVLWYNPFFWPFVFTASPNRVKPCRSRFPSQVPQTHREVAYTWAPISRRTETGIPGWVAPLDSKLIGSNKNKLPRERKIRPRDTARIVGEFIQGYRLLFRKEILLSQGDIPNHNISTKQNKLLIRIDR